MARALHFSRIWRASSARSQGNEFGPEQWIKEVEAATYWTRLSCHRFRANEMRLLLGIIAYNPGNVLRRLVLPLAIQSWSLTSLQRRLFKTGGRLIRHARYSILELAESSLTRRLFGLILGRIERLAGDQTRFPGPAQGVGVVSSERGPRRRCLGTTRAE
jgi:hypothetical protein